MIYFICHVHLHHSGSVLDDWGFGETGSIGCLLVDGADIRTSDEKAVRDNRRDDNLLGSRLAGGVLWEDYRTLGRLWSSVLEVDHPLGSVGSAGACAEVGEGVIMVLCTID